MKSKVFTPEEIYERILNGIMECRLLPGARLIEERLVELTGSSRARIRQVLSRLALEGVVIITPNKGACIASPSIEEAKELFSLRRMIEPQMVYDLAQSISTSDLNTLKQHIKKEHGARHQRDSRLIIKLSGEFHILLAEMSHSPRLLRLVRELVSFNCLIITLYDRPNVGACAEKEHALLLDALSKGEGETAKRLMLEHLNNVEAILDLSDKSNESPDLEFLFS